MSGDACIGQVTPKQRGGKSQKQMVVNSGGGGVGVSYDQERHMEASGGGWSSRVVVGSVRFRIICQTGHLYFTPSRLGAWLTIEKCSKERKNE